MEKYINKRTIVKNEIYEAFKDSIICPICKCIMIEPVICFVCQNTFCKKCKEDLNKKGESCPKNCNNAEIRDVIKNKNLISKFKFKCIKGCREEILFDDIENHYSSDCLSKKKKIKAISSKEVANYRKKNDIEIGHLVSM